MKMMIQHSVNIESLLALFDKIEQQLNTTILISEIRRFNIMILEVQKSMVDTLIMLFAHARISTLKIFK